MTKPIIAAVAIVVRLRRRFGLRADQSQLQKYSASHLARSSRMATSRARSGQHHAIVAAR
jgi:hypothetical protein